MSDEKKRALVLSDIDDSVISRRGVVVGARRFYNSVGNVCWVTARGPEDYKRTVEQLKSNGLPHKTILMRTSDDMYQSKVDQIKKMIDVSKPDLVVWIGDDVYYDHDVGVWLLDNYKAIVFIRPVTNKKLDPRIHTYRTFMDAKSPSGKKGSVIDFLSSKNS